MVIFNSYVKLPEGTSPYVNYNFLPTPQIVAESSDLLMEDPRKLLAYTHMKNQGQSPGEQCPFNGIIPSSWLRYTVPILRHDIHYISK